MGSENLNPFLHTHSNIKSEKKNKQTIEIADKNIWACEHFVTRLARFAYEMQDTDTLLGKINRYLTCKNITDVETSWKNGEILVGFAIALQPSQFDNINDVSFYPRFFFCFFFFFWNEQNKYKMFNSQKKQ